MDRRVKKSRAVITKLYASSLHQKAMKASPCKKSSTGRDVGRPTFYAHFDTKEAFAREVCWISFSIPFLNATTARISLKQPPHFQAFPKNQDKIATCRWKLFHQSLKDWRNYLFPMIQNSSCGEKSQSPEPFLRNYVTSTFVETVSRWRQQKKTLALNVISQYFLDLMDWFYFDIYIEETLLYEKQHSKFNFAFSIWLFWWAVHLCSVAPVVFGHDVMGLQNLQVTSGTAD